MEWKSLLGVGTATFTGAGLALAVVTPVGTGQEATEKGGPPTVISEKVEQANRDGQVAEDDEQTEDRATVRSADGHKTLTVGFDGEFGGSWLGVGIRDVTAEDVATKKLPAAVGALVTDVDEDSPAAKGGLGEGDVIVTFDAERVRSVRQLSRLVRETPAERRIAVEVMRDGQRQTLQVTPTRGSRAWSLSQGKFHDLVESVRKDAERLRREVEPAVRVFGAGPSDFKFATPDFLWSGARLGVSVQPLTGQLAEHFGVKGGVLVSSVEADSPAATAGLKAGDVITAVDGVAVEDPGALRRAVQDPDNRESTLSVTRAGQSLSVKITQPEPAWRTHRERV